MLFSCILLNCIKKKKKNTSTHVTNKTKHTTQTQYIAQTIQNENIFVNMNCYKTFKLVIFGAKMWRIFVDVWTHHSVLLVHCNYHFTNHEIYTVWYTIVYVTKWNDAFTWLNIVPFSCNIYTRINNNFIIIPLSCNIIDIDTYLVRWKMIYLHIHVVLKDADIFYKILRVALLNKGSKNCYKVKCSRTSNKSIWKCLVSIHACYNKYKRVHKKGFFHPGFVNPSKKKSISTATSQESISFRMTFQFSTNLNLT